MTAQFRVLGLKVYPSQTNFILVEFPHNVGKTADDANTFLNQNGVIPRQFMVDDFRNKLRFTVGDDTGMQKTIELMTQFINH